MSTQCYFKLMDMTGNGLSLEDAIEQLVLDGHDDHDIESAAHKLRKLMEKKSGQ